MNPVITLYLVFAALSLIAFIRLDAPRAIAIVYFAGLIYLPPADYLPVKRGDFPFWIVGSALPSDLLLAKAWVAPVAALMGGIIFAPRAWRRFEPRPLDLVMAAWCAWPLLQSAMIMEPAPAGLLSTLYLCGVWGAPWLIGRVYYSTAPAIWEALKVFALVTLTLLPFALWEAVVGPGLYDLLIAPHPFLRDGAERYVGSRPLLFFENGNQYGIWVCCAALAAVAVARSYAGYRAGERWLVIAVILSLMALAAQSIGALALLGVALLILLVRRLRQWFRIAVLPLAFGLVIVGGVYASGVVPVRAWVEGTSVGRSALDMVRATGRGSFSWRISQDQRVAPLVGKAPIIGAGRWDWWRPAGTRPWGLVMLILGQFGLIGLVLAAVALLGGAVPGLAPRSRDKGVRTVRRVLILLVVMALADALLNAFIFLPAMAIAGILAGAVSGAKSKRREETSPVSWEMMLEQNRRRPGQGGHHKEDRAETS